MNRSRALLVAAVLVLPACGVSSEDAPRTLQAQQLGAATAGPSPRPGARPTTLYLVRDAALAPVTRRTASAASARSALELLLRGASAGEGAQGLTSALGPDAVLLDDVVQDGRAVVVPLATTSAGPGRSDEVLAYAQVVATLTALPGVSQVRFVRDGEALPVPRADGSLAEGFLTRRDYADLL